MLLVIPPLPPFDDVDVVIVVVDVAQDGKNDGSTVVEAVVVTEGVADADPATVDDEEAAAIDDVVEVDVAEVVVVEEFSRSSCCTCNISTYSSKLEAVDVLGRFPKVKKR